MTEVPDPTKPPKRGRQLWEGLGKGQIATIVGILALLVATVSMSTDVGWWPGNRESNSSAGSPTTPPAVTTPANSSPSPTVTMRTFGQPVSLTATHAGERQVTITAEILEQPRPGYVYWFILEVHLVSGTHSEWYPRNAVTRSVTFSFTIPQDADITRRRTGAVYEVSEKTGKVFESGRPDPAHPNDDFLLAAPCQCTVSEEVELKF